MDSTSTRSASVADTIRGWPEESREAAQLVLDRYGEPHEVSDSELRWDGVGPWNRIVAQRTWWTHRFPVPHTDSVESFIDYRVPIARLGDIARFDGSVMAERTTGELSARCHDEEANLLALNLTHDIVTGVRSVEDARAYCVQEFLDVRRKQPTPYMEGLRFEPSGDAAPDPDQAVIPPDDLAAAEAEGRARASRR